MEIAQRILAQFLLVIMKAKSQLKPKCLWQVNVAPIRSKQRALLLACLALHLLLLLPLPVLAKKQSDSPNNGSAQSVAVVKPQVRYLNFPERSVGFVQAYTFDPSGFDFGTTRIANACGRVAVPAAAECGLVVNYDGAQDLSFLNKLPPGALVVLQCNNFEISDEQFLSINHLEKMKVLELSSTDIGNRGFEQLKNCSNLVELVMPSCLITGPALASLKDVTTLKRLAVDHNDLDDVSLASLKGLKNLLAVRLQACKIGDAGLAHLKGCQRLTHIDIGQNKKITDNCLPTLLSFKNLVHLDLTDTSVTIVGFRQLSKLPKLRHFGLAFSSVSEKQLAELRRLMPNCQIINTRAGKVPLDVFEPISKRSK